MLQWSNIWGVRSVCFSVFSVKTFVSLAVSNLPDQLLLTADVVGPNSQYIGLILLETFLYLLSHYHHEASI